MSAESKAAILADEGRFQEACGKLVRQGVIQRVSMLMWAIGQDMETASKLFDVDYDEMIGWFSIPDYEEAASYFIRENADLDQLEAIAEDNGYWSDLGPIHEYATYTSALEGDGDEPSGITEWFENVERNDALRESVLELLTNSEDYQKVCEEYSLEPDMMETYEFWAVDSWLADKLKQHGEIVFEFADFTVFGRRTTGQSISMDYVIREICRSMPDYAYVWDVP